MCQIDHRKIAAVRGHPDLPTPVVIHFGGALKYQDRTGSQTDEFEESSQDDYLCAYASNQRRFSGPL